MLALICGEGRLPAALAAAVRGAGGAVLVCELQGFAPHGLTPDLRFRLEHLGSLIADLKARGVTEICLAGAIRRPAIDPGQIDAATRPLVPVIQAALGAGDDGALRAAMAVFEQAGFRLRAAQDLAPDLLPAPGCPTRAAPGEPARADAARGAAIVAAMGAADIGQSCVVHRGQALAVEALFGTDWMLQSLARRADGRGGILYKAPKPGQDRRADLPTIGPGTVEGVVAAGLDGIVIEAGGVIVLDRDAVIAECDRHGLFLWLREAQG